MRDYKRYTILDAAATTGAGKKVDVSDFKSILMSIATDGGGDAALTVKVQGAIDNDAPDFDAAASPSNFWSYIQLIDIEDGLAINGDTGFVVATADDYVLAEVNVNGLKWITANVTARTQGEVTVKILAFNNE